MTQDTKLDKARYIRTLELLAIIGEEFGELTQSINNYNWKGNKIEDLDNCLEELQQMVSPMRELQGLLEVIKKTTHNET